jgi:hypothetical protein
MPGTHALLSASGAHRWLHCTPSARLEETFPETTSPYAEEGTHAHALAELMLRKRFDETLGPRTYQVALDALQADPRYSAEMAESVTVYVDYVEERFNAAKAVCPDAFLAIELRLDLSRWVQESYGTGDVVIVADECLEIIDLKYGKGVAVSAEGNPQLRLYALGALDAFDMLYNIHTIRMTIVQPRLDNISSETMAVEDLLDWAESFVRPRALLAIDGKGEYCPGDHCRFCRARETCRARAEAVLSFATYEFRQPPLLTDDEIPTLLEKADLIRSWIEDIAAYALHAAESGTRFDGWKLVEGRAVRKYADEDAVLARLKASGYDEAILTKRSLLGLTEMEKTIGKKPFSEILAELIIRPAGKPVLVKATDKRPELNSASTDFKEETEP